MATGDLLAVIEADYMGQLRTGAASGVATKYLARENSCIAAIIGTGGQARTQLEAIAAVRKLESARGNGFKLDRKSTRLNSSHTVISYAVFCLKKKKRYRARRSN